MRAVVAGCLFAIAAAAQDQTAQISGTVVDAATHQPVKHATVNLMAPNHGIQPTSTDATGAFSFDALAEGQYVLSATHQNYPPVQGRSRKVEVKAGEHAGSITIEMTPGAVIAGHVFDEDGDPLSGCYVQATSAAHSNSQGGGSNVNQDGEYRIHGLAPGKYLVSARCGIPAFSPRPFSAGPDPPPPLAYPVQYYPLAADSKSAQAVDLAPSAEKPGIDFRIRPAPVTQVRASISTTTGEPHPERALNVNLMSVDRSSQSDVGGGFNADKGFYEFNQVFPGSYHLVAISHGDPASRVSAGLRIEVKDRPVEVTLALARAADLSGSITVEGDNATNKVPLTQIHVNLHPVLPIPAGVDQAQVKEDGTFVLKFVPAGQWKLSLFGPRVYLKSAWLGNTDITHTAFEMTAGAEALRIVVGTNLGAISGTAPAGEMFFAVSEDGMRTMVQVDQTGRFTLPEVPPGKYRVGVADPGLPVLDEGSQEVTVREGETATVDVKQP